MKAFMLTPSSRCVREELNKSAHPWSTRGGPRSKDHTDNRLMPRIVLSWAQTCSPGSYWVRMVSSCRGSVIKTSSMGKKFASGVNVSSTQVADVRFVQSLSAATISSVICGLDCRKLCTAPAKVRDQFNRIV
jgi:hypothetical protein